MTQRVPRSPYRMDSTRSAPALLPRPAVAGSNADAWAVETIELIGPLVVEHRGRWLAFAAIVVAIGLAAWIAISPSPIRDPVRGLAEAASPSAEVHLDRPQPSESPTGGSESGRSIEILVPVEGDFFWSRTIAVAGLAYGRPHSPAVSIVRVDLFVDGALVDSVELDVVSGRYVGVVKVRIPVEAGLAELRIRDPARPVAAAAIVGFSIQPTRSSVETMTLSTQSAMPDGPGS